MTIPKLSPTVRNILLAVLAGLVLVLFGPPAVTAVCNQLTGDPVCGLRLGPADVGTVPPAVPPAEPEPTPGDAETGPA